MVSLSQFVVNLIKRTAGLSAVARVPVELIRSTAIILLLLLIGMGLVVSRELLLLVSPFIAKHAVGFAAFFNVVFTMIMDVVVVIIDIIVVVIRVIDLIRRVVPGCHGANHPPAYKKLGVYTPIDPESVRRYFNDLPNRCHKYNKVGYILSKATKRQTNELLCPVVRASYPVDWMWSTTNALFGWAIVDATPQGVHTLTGEPPGNCRDELVAPDWECIGLGVGYIVVDVLLPIFLLAIVWPYVVTPLFKFLVGSLADVVSLVSSHLAPSRNSSSKKNN